jgi:hypothetical protein
VYQGRFKSFPVQTDEHFLTVEKNRKGVGSLFLTESELNKVPEPICNAWQAGSFLSLPSHKASSRQQRKNNGIGYFPGVF